jgi:hypothetical protein
VAISFLTHYIESDVMQTIEEAQMSALEKTRKVFKE